MSSFRRVLRSILVFGLLVFSSFPVRSAPAKTPVRDPHGDPLPKGAVARLGSVRFLHPDRVRSLAFLPGGKEIVSGSHTDSFSLWDAASGREVRRFVGNGSSVTCMAPSPDGKLVAAGDNGGTLTLWDLTTGKPDRQRALGGPVQALVWSPDGKVLVSSCRGVLSLWELTTDRGRTRVGHAEGAYSLAFSPDGKVLVSAGTDKTLRVWDPATGKELRRLEGRPDHSIVLAVSPDGKWVAGSCSVPLGRGSSRSLMRIWDLATGKKVRDVPAGSISAVAFSPDGKAVVTGDSNCLVRIWDPATGKEVRTLRGHAGAVTALAFSPDGKTLASGGGDRRVRLWDPATGTERRPVTGHSGLVAAALFSPDGREVVSAGRDGTIRSWDWVTGRLLRTREDVGRRWLGRHWGVHGLAYAPDGKRLLSVETQTTRAVFRVWDPAGGRPLSDFGQQYLHVSEVGFLPDGKTVAAAHWDGSVRLWDVGTGKPIRRLGKHDQRLFALAVSPDGQTAAWAGEYGAVGLWDLTSGKGKRLDGAEEFRASDVAFSPDGTLLAAVNTQGNRRLFNPLLGGVVGKGTVQLWDPTTGKTAGAWEGHEDARTVTFSPDGSLLAIAGGQTVALWDVWARQEVGTFAGHRGTIRALAFAPDGKALVSASEDGTLLVWDLTGRLEKGHLRACTLTPEALKHQWEALADRDASRARRALWTLASGERAVPLLGKKLRPVEPVRSGRLSRLIAKLDSDTFRGREDATRDLAALGEVAVPALQKALASGPSPEVRRRAGGLLKAVKEKRRSGEGLRAVRAVLVLEQAGSPAARRMLKALAGGDRRAPLTRHAKAALGRLGG